MIMGLVLQLPMTEREIIVATGQMHRTAIRTLAVHRGGGLVVWHGRARLGKTTTAKWMEGQINQQYCPDNSISFRAVHYEVGEVSKWTGNGMKKGIRSLYHALVGRIDEGLYRQLPAEDLARQFIHSIRRKNIEMVFVDEAGCLSLEAIRGMVLARNVAENEGWTLTIIFVGMDDLPTKMMELPQIRGRIHEWCYFEPYNLDETWALLSELHPYFAGLDARKEKHQEQVKFIHDLYGGVAGEIVPFVRRLAYRLREYKDEPDIRLLRAVHFSTQRDMNRAIEDSRLRYQGKLPEGGAPPQKSKKHARKGDDAA